MDTAGGREWLNSRPFAFASDRTDGSLVQTADQLLRSEGGHIVGIGAGAKARVVAQLFGQGMGDTRAAAAEDVLFTDALGLRQLNQLREVLNVEAPMTTILRPRRSFRNSSVSCMSMTSSVTVWTTISL